MQAWLVCGVVVVLVGVPSKCGGGPRADRGSTWVVLALLLLATWASPARVRARSRPAATVACGLRVHSFVLGVVGVRA